MPEGVLLTPGSIDVLRQLVRRVERLERTPSAQRSGPRLNDYPIDPTTAGATVGTTAETEAAQTDVWAVTDGTTLACVQLTRMAYADAAGQILYGYYRTFKYDRDGRLTSISAETRVTIDTPVT